MDQLTHSRTGSTLLSVALVPRVPSDQFEIGENAEIIQHFRERITRTLYEAGAKELDLGGDGLVVALDSPATALRCAIRMQAIVDRAMANVRPSSQCVLDIGLHFSAEDVDAGWVSGTGFRVVSALRQMTNGEIAASAEFRAGLNSLSRVRFLERGNLIVEGEPETVSAYLVVSHGVAGELLNRLTWPLEQIRQKAGYVAVPGAVAALAFFAFTQDGWRDVKIGDFLLAAKTVDSIEVQPFAGDDLSPRSELYRETLESGVNEALANYPAVSIVRPGGPSPIAPAEATLKGEAHSAGEWLLVRAQLVRTGDGSELWSGSYYKRVDEIDAISSALVTQMARAIGLRNANAGVPARGLAASALDAKSEAARQANLEAVRADLEDALRQAQRLEIDEASRITSLNNLASLYYDSGRDEEAIPLLRRVIKMRETSLGPDHPEVAVALNNLASLYVARGRLAEAEPLYRRSLNIRLAVLGPKHPRVANAMSNLALLYHRQGRWSDAEPLYESALAIRKLELEWELGPESEALSDRAARFEIEGDYTAAAVTYAKAVDQETLRSGPGHVRTAKLTRKLAVARSQDGDVEEAESLLQHAIAIFDRALGPNHEETAASMSDLGELYRREGRLSEAEQYHERALDAFENSLGVDHPEVAGTLGYLVSIFELQGRDKKAAEAGARRDAIRQTYLGPVFTYVAARSAESSVIRDRQQDQLLAPQPLHEYQLDVQEGVFVTERRRLAESLHNMALLYLDLGRYAEAEKYAKEALDVRRQLSEGPNPEVGISLHSLARINTGQERYSDAQARYQEALQVFESTLGHVHPHVAQCWSDMAELLRKLDRSSEAVYAAERARKTRAALLQP